jgi:hypothetical protein
MAIESRHRNSQAPGITSVRVERFKSLRDPQDIAIRPLTVIAGVNSSGKSSAMQPLLLLKQTLDAAHDPGPLQLSGANVDVTAFEQVVSKPIDKDPSAPWFRVGVTADDSITEWRFGRDSIGDLKILEMSSTLRPGLPKLVTLREDMATDELWKALPTDLQKLLKNYSRSFSDQTELAITRDRCFLLPIMREGRNEGGPNVPVAFPWVERPLSRIIHLPALRGNPRRTYPTVAVEKSFPGRFETYTAGVIAAWRQRGQADKLEQLRADLQELKLTWTVEARKLDDTQVELMVGRLPREQPNGRDLVNIADVGFGVSQTLPVIVALLAAGPGHLVYLEQPEIHLHPRAQVTFANLLQRAVARGVRVVVETHSALLIRAVQTLVAQQHLPPSDVILHWFTRSPETGYTTITTGELDQAGAFGDWPEDFDDVHLEAEARYLDAAAEASA